MSHLRVLICRVEDDETEQRTELVSLDLPPTGQRQSYHVLDDLEAQVERTGHQILRCLYELAWEELDAQAVRQYAAQQAPSSLMADGYATLQVACRFGTLQLRRQVYVHRATGEQVLPGNALLPAHHGMLTTRGLQEWACLLAQDLPFASAARLLGW